MQAAMHDQDFQRTPMFTETERRKHFRYKLPLPVRVKPPTPIGSFLETIFTVARDISADGIYFATSKKLEVGSYLDWELTLPPVFTEVSTVRIHCRGRIVRIELLDVQGRIGVAVTIESYKFIRSRRRSVTPHPARGMPKHCTV